MLRWGYHCLGMGGEWEWREWRGCWKKEELQLWEGYRCHNWRGEDAIVRGTKMPQLEEEKMQLWENSVWGGGEMTDTFALKDRLTLLVRWQFTFQFLFSLSCVVSTWLDRYVNISSLPLKHDVEAVHQGTRTVLRQKSGRIPSPVYLFRPLTDSLRVVLKTINKILLLKSTKEP